MYKNQFTKKVFNKFKGAEANPSIALIKKKELRNLIKHKNTSFHWRPHIPSVAAV